MGLVLGLISFVLLLVQVLLFARAILDWSVVLSGPAAAGSLRSRLITGVVAATEPILAPVRRVVPPLRIGGGSVDLAFLVVFFGIMIIRAFI